MSQVFPLWQERYDKGATVLFSQPFDVSAVASISTILEIEAVSAMAIVIGIGSMLDPQDPNSWLNVGVVNGSSVGKFSTVVGGKLSGTTVDLGPFVLFRAVLAGGPTGSVLWSASAVFR